MSVRIVCPSVSAGHDTGLREAACQVERMSSRTKRSGGVVDRPLHPASCRTACRKVRFVDVDPGGRDDAVPRRLMSHEYVSLIAQDVRASRSAGFGRHSAYQAFLGTPWVKLQLRCFGKGSSIRYNAESKKSSPWALARTTVLRVIHVPPWARWNAAQEDVASVKLRLGLIGMGNGWESHYQPALRTLADRFEVTAVFDQITHRAQSVAPQFDAVAVEGFRAVTSRADVDAVLLLSEGWYGVLPVFAACESGKAVYFAAASDMSLEESQRLQRRVRESGVAFLSELLRRHAPATLRLKELMATRLGPPKLIFCHFRSPDPINTSHRSEEAVNSCRHELAELIDWCCFAVGSEPTWVTSTAHSTSPVAPAIAGPPDFQTVTLDFSDCEYPGTGAMAQISCSRYIPACWSEALGYRPRAAMQVACERGIAFLDLPASLVWFDDVGRHQETLDGERPIAERLLTRFFRAVTSLVVSTADLDDTCRAVEILEKADRSHKEGRRIELL